MWRTTLTSCVRRSSVSSGMPSRIRLPSLDGVRPMSDSRIARSIALIELLSYGWTVSSRASGARDRGQLLERRRGAVVVDHDPVQQRRAGAAGADRAELVAGRLDRLAHPLAGVGQQLVDDLCVAHVLTSVPTRSPDTILSMLRSSAMLKTTIGRLLSMHRANAVESITCRPRVSASLWVISGMNSASGSIAGSAV